MFLKKNQLTFIVPLDFSRRGKEIYSRALKQADFFEKNNILAIFGLNLHGNYYADLIFNKLKNFKYVSCVRCSLEEINLSKLRNIALQEVVTDYVVFLDVDIHLSEEVLNFIVENKIDNGINIYPCLYLTKKGNRYLNYYSYSEIIDFYYSFRRDLILHLAFPSFILLCDFKSIKAVGFLDEEYRNHGYEDFDLILRLMKYKEILDEDLSYFHDIKYSAIANMSGFRLLIALPFIKNLLSDFYFIHLYHHKDKADPYYANYNKKYFDNKIKKIFHFNEEKMKAIDNFHNNFYVNFRKYCIENNIDDKRYQVFWDPMPGHMWRLYNLSDYLKNIFKSIFLYLGSIFK